jgi:transposase
MRSSRRRISPQFELLFELVREQVDEASAQALAGAETEGDEAQPNDKPREKGLRRSCPRRGLFPDLPRETVTAPVSDHDRRCRACGLERESLGHGECEHLEYEPAQFRVRRIRREKRAYRKCRDTVVRAPAPLRVVEGGTLGSGLVAQVVVVKFLEHTRSTASGRSTSARG